MTDNRSPPMAAVSCDAREQLVDTVILNVAVPATEEPPDGVAVNVSEYDAVVDFEMVVPLLTVTRPVAEAASKSALLVPKFHMNVQIP